MNRTLLFALLSLCALSANSQTRINPRQNAKSPATSQTIKASPGQTLPIRRVILYSNGVAYIERRGIVSGTAEINLAFKQSQVDDVLKSMLVLDLGAGRIGAVSYNSSAPPSARMAEIPFSVESNTEGASGGMAKVLSQLQGARVSVASIKGAAVGSILTIEKRDMRRDEGKSIVPTYFLVIASETGEIFSFDLAEVRSIKLLDEGTRKDLNEFANATASARRRDAKTITVTSEGAGAREMVVSYTIAAPIWKTTYRVVLDQEGKPFFQGWAIVDNVSDEDWTNVQLSLVSGTPVSFIQPIQQPFYRYRPVIPMPSDLKLSPQVYESGGSFAGSSDSVSGVVRDPNGAVVPNASVIITNSSTNQQFSVSTDAEGNFSTSELPAGNYTISVNSPGFQTLRVGDVSVGTGRTNNLNLILSVGNVANTVTVSSSQIQQLPTSGRRLSNNMQLMPNGGDGPERETTISDALTNNRSGVETAATGAEIGDLFEYKIEQAVTVRRDRSALIPIVQTKMDGERVSIFNEATRRDRALSGMLLKNLTPLTFESGSLTVIDGNAYAGEALMERLKPKEQRFISFALDLGTSVTTKIDQENEPARIFKAVNGTFQVHYFRTDKKIYTLTNQTDRPRVVYIEHPIRQGYDLTDETPKPDITTQRYYRFRVELKAFDKASISIGERLPLMDSYALRDLARTDIEMFVSRRYINDATRQKLEKLIELRLQINSIAARLMGFEEEEEKIAEDQKRLRENIETLSKTPEAKTLITRYIAKADEQETRIEQISKERQTLNAERARLENELAAAIRAFEV